MDTATTEIYTTVTLFPYTTLFLSTNKKAGQSPLFCCNVGANNQASLVSLTAFIDRRMRPCLSTSSTLTLTRSPSLSLSETFSTRSSEICDTCTRPSLHGAMEIGRAHV